MARELFGEVSNRTVAIRSRARYMLPVSIVLHVVIFGVVLLVPVMAPDLMPTPPALLVFAAPAPPPPPPPGPPAQPPVSKSAPAAAERSDAAPLTAPEAIAAEGPPTRRVPDGIGVVDGVEGGLDLPGAITGVPTAPPAPPAPAPPQPVRPGGDIRAPVKTRHVPPVYPSLAQHARVEGLVILEATIDVDGRVRDVRVLRSVPLLNQAAIDAVMQWRFTPTLLNGVPVPVIMSVTVHFTLVATSPPRRHVARAVSREPRGYASATSRAPGHASSIAPAWQTGRRTPATPATPARPGRRETP